MSPLLLIAFTLVLAFVAAPRLAGASWVLRAPRLALTTWLVGSCAVVASSLLTGLNLLLYWDRTHDLVSGAWHFCLDSLLGRHDAPAQVAAVVGLLTVAGLCYRMGLGITRLAAAQRARRADLRMLVRLAGIPSLVPGATVVRHDQPAAYLMPGKTTDIVITSGAVDQLRAPELHAVLAHERAHASGRHYHLTHWVRFLVQAFPGVACFRLAKRQVERLVELCADDTAARSAARIDLARALVTMARPVSADSGLLAAGGGDSLERLHRLLTPPRPLTVFARACVAAGVAAVAVAPLALAMFDRYVSWVPDALSL
ncbi:M56 family metallopeptidase [Dactylosporangium siamense]|uniref:Membrane protein n=1 Tax=Dactylosporangium siamense TaxID=685454 RepID=A0A919PRV1_9ACTN|nr:M56 family metallopeptidase [Dactylosporangium siamense]GIG47258.1 membrane protein [Dactylosporangium siamense]